MEVCNKLSIPYERLKFYCNKGLVPNIKRDKNNHRVFDENDIKWVQDIICLKKCNMSLKEIHYYLILCMEGKKSINSRKSILNEKKNELNIQIADIKNSIQYIEKKQKVYDDFLNNKIPYKSNIIK